MNQKGISKVLIISLVAVIVLSIIYIVSPKTGEAPVVIENDPVSSLPTTNTSVSNTQTAPSKPTQTTTPKPASTSLAKKVATIVFPAGGESLLVGKTYSIRWSDYTSLEPITLVLQTINSDGKSSVKNLAVNIPATITGSYPWVIPYEGGDNKYRIQLFPGDKRALAVSSRDFYITLYETSATKVTDPGSAVVPYATPATGYAPLNVGFSIPEVPGFDYEGSDFMYTIDYGDKSAVEVFSKTPAFTLSHIYSVPGTYTATIMKKTGCNGVQCSGPTETLSKLVVKVDKRP